LFWFPRPLQVSDLQIILAEGLGLSAEELFNLLNAEDAEEWIDKVAVAGGLDGSGKSTTRLMASGGWVFKTHLFLSSPTPEKPNDYATTQHQNELKYGVWHPEKLWFLLQYEGQWYPVSATPKLRTIHSLKNVPDALQAWVRILRLMTDTWAVHKVFLDANPSNFGFKPNNPDRIYYLDDEVYPNQQPVLLSTALGYRIVVWNDEMEAELWNLFMEDATEVIDQLFLEETSYDIFADALITPRTSSNPWVKQWVTFLRKYRTSKTSKRGSRQPILQPTTETDQHYSQENPVNTPQTPDFDKKELTEKQKLTISDLQKWTLKAVEDSKNNLSSSSETTEFLEIENKIKPITEITEKSSGKEVLVVIADIHANLPAMEAVLADAAQFDVTGYLFLGDLVGYGPHPRECMSLINTLPRLFTVQGNHDVMVAKGEMLPFTSSRVKHSLDWTIGKLNAEERAWLAAMPPTLEMMGFYAIHGSLLNEKMRFGYIYETTYEDNLIKAAEMGHHLVWYAHSHLAMVYYRPAPYRYIKHGPYTVNLEDMKGTLLVNPGSVGQPRDGDRRAAYAIYDQNAMQIHFRRVEYDFLRVQRDIFANQLPADYADRLAHGR
jgi:predicted phosphodiesterase